MAAKLLRVLVRLLALAACARAFSTWAPPQHSTRLAAGGPLTTPTRPQPPVKATTRDDGEETSAPPPPRPGRKRARPDAPGDEAGASPARLSRGTVGKTQLTKELAARKAQQELLLSEKIQESREVFAHREQLAARLGRAPTSAEWSAQAGITPDEIVAKVVAGRRARERLVSINRGLVTWLSRKYARLLPQGSEWDLVQDGNLGLIRAAELFDPSKGACFSTYATQRIRAHMLLHLKGLEPIHVPRPLSELGDKIRKISVEYEAMGKTVSDEQLADLLDVPKKKILEAKAAVGRSFVNFNPAESDYEQGALSTLSGEQERNEVDHLLMLRDMQDAMAASLSTRELKVIQVRFGLEDGVYRSQREAAEILGLSKECVRQTCLRGFKKVAQTESGRALSAYMCDP